MMNKRLLSLLLAALLFASLLAACAPSEADNIGETRLFTDSVGREVELPARIDSVAPSGSYAQLMLYTLCPEKLASLSAAFTKRQKRFVDEKYWELPVLGQFYGGGSTLNLEGIIAIAPDVIIDIGEEKDGIADDMDNLQQRSGIPVIYVNADLENMAAAYETLGEILGVEARAGELAGYAREVLDMAAENSAKIPENERVRAMYSQGEYGTGVNAAGSVHSEALELVGAKNVAELSSFSDSGGDEVNMEQIIIWDPEALILAPDSCYDEIYELEAWRSVSAVKNGRVYEAPSAPWNWLDRPPSVQRLLGVLWLGNLLYPELYDYDMTEKAIEFYKLFYQYDLTEAEAAELMKNAR